MQVAVDVEQFVFEAAIEPERWQLRTVGGDRVEYGSLCCGRSEGGRILLHEPGHLREMCHRRMPRDGPHPCAVLRPEPQSAESTHRQAGQAEWGSRVEIGEC